MSYVTKGLLYINTISSEVDYSFVKLVVAGYEVEIISAN